MTVPTWPSQDRTEAVDLARRWRQRHPDLARERPDPSDDRTCSSCPRAAWRRYDGRCGWCHDTQEDQ